MIREKLVSFILANVIVFSGIAISQGIEVETEEETLVYVGDYRVTAYAYYEGGEENFYTASGAEPVPYYTVATTEEFSFGTILYIEGIGYVEVQDRGGFSEEIIDLHIGWDSMDSFEDRTRAVYIVKGE